MNRKRFWLVSLGILSAIAFTFSSYHASQLFASNSQLLDVANAQTPEPSPLTPTPAPLPPVPVPVNPPSTPSFAPPASTAPPLPLSNLYQDPGKRFRVGILQDYKVSPLAGSVLIESPDGTLAYTVVPQSQPLGNPIGLNPGSDNSDSLAKVAIAAFQRGEGFQPTPAQPEEGGGAVFNWTGTLTLGGTTQPMSGIVLVRPSSKTILLLLIAATQASADKIPSAVSALANSLEAL
jgi:hypothetical protein